MKLNSKYNHTQVGYLMIFSLLAMVLYLKFIPGKIGLNMTLVVIMIPIVFLILSFVSLNVVIDEKYLRIKFGYGLFKRHFDLQEIASVKIVKNHWYYGWGIRSWSWPRMRIFNVSGFDAVEIKMKDDKIYRIGTDEPSKLENAIMQSIK